MIAFAQRWSKAAEPNSDPAVPERAQDLRRVSGTTPGVGGARGVQGSAQRLGPRHDLIFVPEYEIETPAKHRRYVDGALLHELRVPFGYWEAKDEKDDLDDEIDLKFRRGYPQDNIVFEDSTPSRPHPEPAGGDPLPGRRRRPAQAPARALLRLRARRDRRVPQGRRAVQGRPAGGARRRCATMIEDQLADNAAFRAAAASFLEHAQETINPTVTEADVREMLIQHILTEEIFAKVFGDDDFHRQNNVAQEALRAGGRILHRRRQEADAEGAGALLRRHPRSGRADLEPPREADLPQGHLRELLQGLQPQGGRPAGRGLYAQRDRALHDRERRLAVPEVTSASG